MSKFRTDANAAHLVQNSKSATLESLTSSVVQQASDQVTHPHFMNPNRVRRVSSDEGADSVVLPTRSNAKVHEAVECVAQDQKNFFVKYFTPRGFKEHRSEIAEWVVVFLVVCNSLQIGCCVSIGSDSTRSRTCVITRDCFNTAFLIEMVLKLIGLGPRKYFRKGWNCFDFILVIVAVVGDWLHPLIFHAESPSGITILRFFRMARMGRLTKVVRMKRELSVIVEGLMKSLQSIGWVSLLLGVIIYVSAIISVECFGEVDDGQRLRFETLGEAAFSLFSIAIIAEWTDVVKPILEDQPFSVFFFLIYFAITAFGIMNLIIGVICEKTVEVKKEFEKEQDEEQRLQRMRAVESLSVKLFNKADVGHNERISRKEMHDVFASTEPEAQTLTQRLLDELHLPYRITTTDLLRILDQDGDDDLTTDEFFDGVANLIFCDEHQSKTLILASIARLRHQVCKEQDKTRKELGVLRDEVTREIRSLGCLFADSLRLLPSAGAGEKSVAAASHSSGSDSKPLVAREPIPCITSVEMELARLQDSLQTSVDALDEAAVLPGATSAAVASDGIGVQDRGLIAQRGSNAMEGIWVAEEGMTGSAGGRCGGMSPARARAGPGVDPQKPPSQKEQAGSTENSSCRSGSNCHTEDGEDSPMQTTQRGEESPGIWQI